MHKYSINTTTELIHLFWPEFIDIDGSIFVKRFLSNLDFHIDDGEDRTGLESFLNHFHILDLVRQQAVTSSPDGSGEVLIDSAHPDFLAMVEVGKTMAQMWFQKLKIDFPDYDFRVYYTRDDDPVVRFHRVWEGEPNWLDGDTWMKDIKCGIVIVYDTRTE
jgi:hypothetical protein